MKKKKTKLIMGRYFPVKCTSCGYEWLSHAKKPRIKCPKCMKDIRTDADKTE